MRYRRPSYKEHALEDNDLDLVKQLKLVDDPYLKRSAILLFHPEPDRFFTGARVKIGYFESEAEVLYHDEVDGDLLSQVRRTMDLLLTKYLKAVISYEGIQRIETYPVPDDALREAVLNAVIHRNYGVPAPIQIRVYADRLWIWNPGELPADWSLETLLSPHSSQPFNPDIASVFFWAGEIESWGRGIQRIFDACRQERMPDPHLEVAPGGLWVKFQFSNTYLRALHLIPKETTQEDAQKTVQENILAQLRKNPGIAQKVLADHLGISYGSVRYHIGKLKEYGHIRRVGSERKGLWEVVDGKSEGGLKKQAENRQKEILSLLCRNPEMTQKALAEHVGITYGSARYHIEKLKEYGYIRRVGSERKGLWEVVDDKSEGGLKKQAENRQKKSAQENNPETTQREFCRMKPKHHPGNL